MLTERAAAWACSRAAAAAEEEEGAGRGGRHNEMEREGCRLGMGTHSLPNRFVTLPTSQLEMSWLKASAPANTARVRERERERQEDGCGEKERRNIDSRRRE